MTQIDANHLPGWAARKKTPRGQPEGAAKATSDILSLRSPNQLWRTRRKSALFPHCRRIATLFVSSLRCGLTAPSLATCAQEDFCSQQYRQDEHCQ